MELIIIVLLIAYAAAKDILFCIEREKLTRKLMSKDLPEYISSIEPEADDTPQEENPFIPIEDATIEQILKAKDIVWFL